MLQGHINCACTSFTDNLCLPSRFVIIGWSRHGSGHEIIMVYHCMLCGVEAVDLVVDAIVDSEVDFTVLCKGCLEEEKRVVAQKMAEEALLNERFSDMIKSSFNL